MGSYRHGARSAGEWLTRRGALRLGALGVLGVSCDALLHGRARGSPGEHRHPPGFGRARSCMLIWLKGGPSQLDTFDMKPHAAAEIRGEFKDIATNVASVRVGEHLPNLARCADLYRVIRSVCHQDLGHPSAAYQMTTGHPYPRAPNLSEVGTREDDPHLGATVAALGAGRGDAPPFAMVPRSLVVNGQFRSGQHAGFLGPRYDPLVPEKDPNEADFEPSTLGFGTADDQRRLQARRPLLAALESCGAAIAPGGMDEHYRHAWALLDTSRVREAFDMAAVPSGGRDAYGRNFFGQSVLLGRRLIEAGVRLVHVNCISSLVGGTNNWDTHKDNFGILRKELLPRTDQAIAALLTDLAASGLLDETLVVITGEFGRTPRINKDAGRDHWASAFSVVVAGAGITGGGYLGATDRSGALPAERPVPSGQLAATIFHALGIDPATQLRAPTGRPWQIAGDSPVTELWA